MSTLSISTCVTALNGAALSRKAAFQIELAVGLAVFLVEGDANKNAKSQLCEAYAAAGYQCLTTDDVDYKTVNRRINVTADLFNVVTVRTVKKWVGKSNENEMLDAIVKGLQPYELQNVSDVQRYCEPPKPRHVFTAIKSPVTTIKPNAEILQGPAATGVKPANDMLRRATDEKDATQLKTEHISVVVPKSADREELVKLARLLLDMADEMRQAA